MPPIGRSVHIGVNSPPGSRVKTPAPEAIARRMAEWAAGEGYWTSLLVGEEATVDAVRGAIVRACTDTHPEDIVLVTFAGHGNRLLSDSSWEKDYLDEVWMLQDGYLRDKELREMLRALRPGARGLVVSESCYAGGIPSLMREAFKPKADKLEPARQQGGAGFREWFREEPKDAEEPPGRGSVRYFLSTDEEGLAFVLGDDGVYSRCLLEVLAGAPPDYLELALRIEARMAGNPAGQRPAFNQIGAILRGRRWGRPFAIDPTSNEDGP